MKKVHKTQKPSFYPIMIKGVIISLLISIITSGTLGIITLNTAWGDQIVSYIVSVIQMVSVFVGALIACKQHGQKYIMISAILCAGYYLILVAATILLFDCSFDRFGAGTIMCVTGAAFAGVVCLFNKTKRTHKKRRL